MKWSTILTCSIWLLCIVCSSRSTAQELTAGGAIYDFTGKTAAEFYILAPGIMAGYDLMTFSRLRWISSLGISYNSIKYDGHRHHLWLLPVFTTLLYDAPNPGSRLRPYLGAGLSLAIKADRNVTFDKTHYAFTYGYHAAMGVKYELKTGISLLFDMRYNLLIPPVMEEIDISGMVITTGVSLPVNVIFPHGKTD
ncbi:MAG: outer membrane beta-barrel protein [Bacteroidales bacterium]|nr:outer membrane beta-barrel protein [Bacteroidales bacterium]